MPAPRPTKPTTLDDVIKSLKELHEKLSDTAYTQPVVKLHQAAIQNTKDYRMNAEMTKLNSIIQGIIAPDASFSATVIKASVRPGLQKVEDLLKDALNLGTKQPRSMTHSEWNNGLDAARSIATSITTYRKMVAACPAGAKPGGLHGNPNLYRAAKDDPLGPSGGLL